MDYLSKVILKHTGQAFQSDKKAATSRKGGTDSSPPSTTSSQGSEEPGQRLKHVRERLKLKYRDVEEASMQIASRNKNDEFLMQLSRLSDIENKGTIPSIYRLYSLCTIYRLNMEDVLGWYGVSLANQPADAASIPVQSTHLIGFKASPNSEVQMPLLLDPGLDPRRTTHFSRMIQKWGTLPLTLLNSLDTKNNIYAFIGSEDWSMYPLIQPGSLVLVDETRRKIVNSGWSNEFERPIYFLEHRHGYACVWCTLNDGQLVLQPHPASMCSPEVYRYPEEIDIIGQVTGLAMHLDPVRRRRVRA